MKPRGYSCDALSIYDLCRQGTRALGPGVRYVIWTQGCLRHCSGCVTSNSRLICHDKQVRVEDLAEDIVSRPYMEGVTISGGEPFLQATALVNLLEIVQKKRPELTIISFTGYQREELVWSEAERLINHLDLLIDGPYVESLNDDMGLRGSSNQRFHYFTPRLLPWKEEMEHGKRKVEYHVFNEEVKAYGVPSNAMLLALNN